MPKKKDIFWEHAEELKKDGKKDWFRCNYCKNDFSGGISRVKSHLSGLRGRDIKICEQVPEDVKKAAVQALAALNKKAKCLGASNRMVESAKFTIPTSSSHNISNVRTEEHKLRVDKHLAEYFLSECIRSEALQSPFFIDFVKDIAEYGPGYVLPSSLTLESQLIPDVSKEVMEYVENVKRSSRNTGCTLLFNFEFGSLTWEIFLHASEGWACFRSGHQNPVCSPHEILESIIEFLGPKNIVQIFLYVVSAHVQSIQFKVSEKYPWICLIDCYAEDINNFVSTELLFDTNFVKTIIYMEKLVMSFIYSYDIEVPLRRVSEYLDEEAEPWISYYLLKVLLEVEEELKSLQTSIIQLSKSAELLEQGVSVQERYLRHGKLVDYIIHCEEFWTRAKAIAQFMLPVFQTHCLVKGIGSTPGYLYEMMERVSDAIEKFRDSNCAFYDNVWPSIKRARKKIIRPMHVAAAFLNPAYMCSENFKENDEMRSGINYLLEFMVVEEEKESFMEEFQQYRMKVLSIFTTQARIMLKTSHPRIWWDYCGSHLPILRKYALKLLSQPCHITFFKHMLEDFKVQHDIEYLMVFNIHMMRRFKDLETQMLKPIILDKLGEFEYGEFIDQQPFGYDDSFWEYILWGLSDDKVDNIINDSWLD